MPLRRPPPSPISVRHGVVVLIVLVLSLKVSAQPVRGDDEKPRACPTPANRQQGEECGGSAVGVCRKDGTCACDLGYAGDSCEMCADSYHEVNASQHWGTGGMACISIGSTSVSSVSQMQLRPAQGSGDALGASAITLLAVLCTLIALAAVILLSLLRHGRAARRRTNELRRNSSAGGEGVEQPIAGSSDLQESEETDDTVGTLVTVHSNPLATPRAPASGQRNQQVVIAGLALPGGAPASLGSLEHRNDSSMRFPPDIRSLSGSGALARTRSIGESSPRYVNWYASTQIFKEELKTVGSLTAPKPPTGVPSSSPQ